MGQLKPLLQPTAKAGQLQRHALKALLAQAVNAPRRGNTEAVKRMIWQQGCLNKRRAVKKPVSHALVALEWVRTTKTHYGIQNPVSAWLCAKGGRENTTEALLKLFKPLEPGLDDLRMQLLEGFEAPKLLNGQIHGLRSG